MQNRSQISNQNSHDNTFNFGNQLDISNTKKNKNSELGFKDSQAGFKDGFQFDDFQNIGDDKTIKSSFYKTRKDNFSNIIKKQFDQGSNFHQGNSILQNQQDLGLAFHTKPIISASMRKIYYEEQKYPKFGKPKNPGFQQMQNVSHKNHGLSGQNFKQSDLAYTKSNFNGIDPISFKQEYKDDELNVNSRVNLKNLAYFPKKEQVQGYLHEYHHEPGLLSRQSQYKQMLSMINFYKNQAQKINYQRISLQQQSIRELVTLSNSQLIQEQIRNRLQNINYLNIEIDKERAIQKKLSNVINDLEYEYNQIVESIQEMDFRRPVIIKDDVKVLIDEINQLKYQFQNLYRENGSLRLSCTLEPSSLQPYLKQETVKAIKKTHSLSNSMVEEFQSLFEEIHLQNSKSEDSQFVKNLKLSCIKNQWIIFTNKQIQISLDYSCYPYINMSIGNKTNQLLKRFFIQVEGMGSELMSNEILNKKSFIVERIKVNELMDILIKVRISYEIEIQEKGEAKANRQVKLFCPNGLINYGEFVPMSYKQLEIGLHNDLPIMSSALRTLDKNIVGSLQEILMYFPNLQLHENPDKILFGKFLSIKDEETLIIIEDHYEFVKIKVKKSNPSLLKLLQFIFCL